MVLSHHYGILAYYNCTVGKHVHPDKKVCSYCIQGGTQSIGILKNLPHISQNIRKCMSHVSFLGLAQHIVCDAVNQINH